MKKVLSVILFFVFLAYSGLLQAEDANSTNHKKGEFLKEESLSYSQFLEFIELKGPESAREKLNSAILNKTKNGTFRERIYYERAFPDRKWFLSSSKYSWELTGRYSRFGERDLWYGFTAENLGKTEDNRIIKHIKANKDGRLYPLGDCENPKGIYYLTASFKSDDPVRLRVTGDMEYRLFVNGNELIYNRGTEPVYRGVELHGSVSYTVMMKFRGGRRTDSLRVILTDINDKDIKLKTSDQRYSLRFNHRKLGNVDMVEYPAGIIPGKAEYALCNYEKSLDLSKRNLKRDIHNYYSWHYYLKSLAQLERKDDIAEGARKYRKIFPKSLIYRKWLAEVLSEKDSDNFIEVYSGLPFRYRESALEKKYIGSLISKGKFKEALDRFAMIRGYPGTDDLVMTFLERSGKEKSLRKFLLKGAALTKRSVYYKKLGDLDLKKGLDPVPYWKMAVYRSGIVPELMKKIDLHENGIVDGKFHTPRYTGKTYIRLKDSSRRVIKIFYINDRLFLEFEDKINKNSIKNGTYYPEIDGKISLRYCLKIKGKKQKIIRVSHSGIKGRNACILDKAAGRADYYIFKYTADAAQFFGNYEGISRRLHLLKKGSPFSRVRVEYETDNRNVIPYVSYSGIMTLAESKDKRFTAELDIRNNQNEDFEFVLYRFGSYSGFSRYYSDMMGIGSDFSPSLKYEDNGDLRGSIVKLTSRLHEKYKISGSYNLKPRRLEDVASSDEATVEEMVLLMRRILKTGGIVSYVAFDLENGKKMPPSTGKGPWLYIPVDIKEGWFVDMSKGTVVKSEKRKIILMKKGYRIYQNNPGYFEF